MSLKLTSFTLRNLAESSSSNASPGGLGPATFYATSTWVGLRGVFAVPHNLMCSVFCAVSETATGWRVCFLGVPKI
jgi:hypothetical protein